MTSHPTRRGGNIIVGVDGSPLAEHAVLWAVEEARLQHRGLTLVHAQKQLGGNEKAWLASAGITPAVMTDQLHEEARVVLERARVLAADRIGDLDVETVLRPADPRSLLLEVSASAPLLVVGSRGHGTVVGLLLGSVSGALVRHAECPVAVVRPSDENRRGVLVGADGSEASMVPLELAYAEASARGMPLTVLHCLWDALTTQVRWSHLDSHDPEIEGARRLVAESLGAMTEKYPDVPVHVSVALGAVDACLVDLSRQFDLLVIGRPPRTLGERLTLSGLTTSVAEHAHAPVIVVP